MTIAARMPETPSAQASPAQDHSCSTPLLYFTLSSASLTAAGRWRGLMLFLLLASTLGRLLYLADDCRLDLAPDEAHYWDWSRQLDWSYYSKGPLVAWLIRASCAMAGSWSRQLTGGDMLAVRLPALVCGSLLLLSLYVLTVQVFGRERLACAVVAFGLTIPLVAAGSTLMTIDSPYTCCWGWALVLGHRAIFKGSAWAWPAAGLVVGLGILAKYTMLLWVASLGLFLLTSPEHRRLLRRPGPWILAGIAAACCVPILVWNMRHDWVSGRHVSGQAGLGQGLSLLWLGPLEYLAVQAGLLLVFWFVVWVRALLAHRPSRERDEGKRFLWWMSLPSFVLFLGFSLTTHVEPNWPVTAYLSGMVLSAGWLGEELRTPTRWRRWLAGGGLAAACLVGLLLTVTLYRSDLAQPLLECAVGPPTADCPQPLRQIDPTCRLRGWRHLAAAVDRLRAELRAKGVEPLLAGVNWGLPGELAFYCEDQPTVYALGLALGDRHSQYDLWRPNPLADPEGFAGRTFIVVGEAGSLLHQAFDRLETPRYITYFDQGQPIAVWPITVCHGFRGFPSRQGRGGW